MFRNLPYNISVLRPCFHEQMHWGVFRLEVGEFRLGYIFFQIAALRLITSLYYSTFVWIFFRISVVKVNRFCEVTLTSDNQNLISSYLSWSRCFFPIWRISWKMFLRYCIHDKASRISAPATLSQFLMKLKKSTAG